MTDPPTVLAMAEALRIAREALAASSTAWANIDAVRCTRAALAEVGERECGSTVVALARIDALVAFTPDPPEDPT